MSFIETTTGEIMDHLSKRRSFYISRKGLLTPYQHRSIKKIAPVVIAGLVLAVTLMGLSR